MIYMQIYGNGPVWWHAKATMPGVLNPSGTQVVWTVDAPGCGDPHSTLQSALNRLASKVQASKPFPRW